MANQPLKADEAAAFSNIAEFNATKGKSDFVLRDRDTSGLNLKGIALVGATFENVQLDRAAMAGAQVRFSKFVRCKFLAVDLDRGMYEEAEFSGCAFESCEIDGTNFAGCRFAACTFQNCKFRTCVLAEAKFTGCSLGEVEFTTCDLARAAFAQTKLGLCVLRRCDITDCVFADVQLRKTRIIEPRGSGATFSGGEIVRSGVEDAAYFRALTFKGAKIQGLTLDHVHCDGLVLEDLPEAVAMKFRSCTLKGVKMARCKDVIEPCFTQTKVEGFEAAQCEFLCPRFGESKLEKGVVIDACTFDGCDLSESTILGATIKASSFDNGLNVGDAVLAHLKLPGVTYGPGYRPAGKAKYVEAEKFKGT
jgi:uncharacterized protein YjbI with pentapeptide repeats